MAQITYKNLKNGSIRVYLDNRPVGAIKPVAKKLHPYLYQYRPEGSAQKGDIGTLLFVKRSIEGRA